MLVQAAVELGADGNVARSYLLGDENKNKVLALSKQASSHGFIIMNFALIKPGVHGVPHFAISGPTTETHFSGAYPPEAFVEAFHEVL